MAKVRLLLVVTALSSGACSSSFNLTTGPAAVVLQHPPYYATVVPVNPSPVAQQAQIRVGYFAAGYQGERLPVFGPRSGVGSAIYELLTTINQDLKVVGDSLRFASLGPPLYANPHIPPDVRFGCERGDDDCVYDGRREMRLVMNLPSRQWVQASAVAFDSAGAGYALVITLELGNYWLSQTNWRGSKAVELGTAYVMPVPWLTDLETPVSVIQLTGALIGRDGKAIRLGAEGILARRTEFKLSALIPGAQRSITDGDVRAALALRREDLPGSPLAWQVALRTLVTQLATAVPGR